MRFLWKAGKVCLKLMCYFIVFTGMMVTTFLSDDEENVATLGEIEDRSFDGDMWLE